MAYSPLEKSRFDPYWRCSTLALVALVTAALAVGWTAGWWHIVSRVEKHHINLFSSIYPQLEPGDLVEGRKVREVHARNWALARADSFARDGASI